MVVYRVEMPDGYGPYWSNYSEQFKYKMLSKHSNHDTHPTGFDDFPSAKPPGDWRFGFSSIKKLFSWFGGFLPIILKNGGRIVKYTVDQKNTINGWSGKQLVFNRETAQLVNA